jgi:NAD(P)-dependent dehydrogenase (short-subunit alcohol dehydrogenase family)
VIVTVQVRLKGKVVLLTGGGSGIGATIAKVFCSDEIVGPILWTAFSERSFIMGSNLIADGGLHI